MNFHTTWVLAKAEMRSCRRLTRTWVFIWIALLLCTSMYILDIGNASLTSWPDPPYSWIHHTIAPQYAINDIVFGFVAVFMVGIIFLCFDIRARDVQNRISEVIDSRPANNLEVTVGRLAGILFVLLVPILIFLVSVTCYEVFAHFLGFSYGYGVVSVVVAWSNTLETMLLLLFFGSLVACLASLIPNRLLVAVFSIGVVIGVVTLSNHFFSGLQEALIHSDIASAPFTATGLVNQLALVLISIAFVVFASSLLPRTQPRRQLFNLGGGFCFLAGTLCYSGVLISFDEQKNLRNEWIATHSSQPIETFPDIEHVRGEIHLWPRNTIEFDLTLTVLPPASNSTESVVFSLNPGYSIQEVFVDGKEIVDHSFTHGLLKIAASELNGDVHQLRIKAQGKPDEHFAYLDQARNILEITSAWIARLGTKNYIFHPRFVALMPSIKWYPTSGTAMHEDLLEHRPRDVFTTNLTVSVPQNWSVAMVGNRELISRGERYTYRFKTQAPVPEVALIGSNFEQRSKTIEGIGLELLFSKKHLKNLDVLALHASDFEDWVTERITSARELSLEYPYEAFYVVEVPSTLRIYGGGWRMDTVLHPPGMMLVRETTFPTARFETVIGEQEFDIELPDTFVRNIVVSYFRDDLQGGSPFAGISRNFVNHLSSPAGRGSTAINYLLEQLATQLIMKQESLFIPSLWEYGLTSESADLFDFDYNDSRIATKKRLDLVRTPSTWDEIERTPLFELDFRSRPIPSFRALLTKGYALAQSMIEYYGAEKISAFLSRLTNTFEGQYYTLEDFVEIAGESEIDLNDWVLDWLEATTLPGFLAANPRVTKLNSDEDSPYQTTFVLHNAESVPGFVKVQGSGHPDPFFLLGHQSVEIAIQTNAPMYEIWIQPYLAQNRERFPVRLPKYDGKSVSDDPLKPLVSIVEWSPQDSSAIVVDDLDPGFSIVGQTGKKRDGFKLPWIEFGPIFEETLDQGLPVRTTSIVGEWERKSDPYSYSFGRYRHTLALIARGKQNTYAKFAANLPHSGSWKLEYFVPGRGIHVESYSFVEKSGTLLASEGFYANRVRIQATLKNAIPYKLKTDNPLGTSNLTLQMPH